MMVVRGSRNQVRKVRTLLIGPIKSKNTNRRQLREWCPFYRFPVAEYVHVRARVASDGIHDFNNVVDDNPPQRRRLCQ
jgi:hypothetical protein